MEEKELSILINFSILCRGIILFALTLVFLDSLGQRKKRREQLERKWRQ
jgi:hypothetical protein